MRAEPRFSDRWFEALGALGHDPKRTGRIDTGMGHAHAIQRTEAGYAVATEPRAEGAALGL
jgi:gamma-glutamyltranspeptidase